MIREFPDADLFTEPMEDGLSFLEPLIESWDIDLNTFGVELVLNRRLTQGHRKRFEFVEREPDRPFDVEPGLEEFLKDASLGCDATDDEIEFLKELEIRAAAPDAFILLPRVAEPASTRFTSSRPPT